MKEGCVRLFNGTEVPERPYQRQERIEREHAEMKAQLTKLEDFLKLNDFGPEISNKIGLVDPVDIAISLIEDFDADADEMDLFGDASEYVPGASGAAVVTTTGGVIYPA